MKTLKTVRLKPNPSGKDRTRRGGDSVAQLGGEWVDLRNSGNSAVDMVGVSLFHIAYSGTTENGTWEKVMSFKGVLPVGQIVRIHAGPGPLETLNAIDQQGANFHVFTGQSQYVWNNDRGDCSALWLDGEKSPFDRASYSPNPPEGVILVRTGDSLVASSATLAATGSRH